MSSPSAILHTTTTTYTLLPRLKSLKIVSTAQFPSSKLLSPAEFVSQKPFSLCKRAWSPNTMNESATASALRGGSGGDEGVRAFESESFIDGSSELGHNFTYVGLESTLNRGSKWIVTALFGAVLLLRHDAESLWAAMGSVVNAGLSTVLKKILNQERPVANLRSDPGMPSSHAQAIFFTAIFAVISMLQWLGVNGLTITLSCLALAFGSYLSWLRVSQKLHTISQVLVGAVVGSAFSILWFMSWDVFVLKAFISYLWVRIIVVLGSAGFCLGFLLYVIQYWVKDEE